MPLKIEKKKKKCNLCYSSKCLMLISVKSHVKDLVSCRTTNTVIIRKQLSLTSSAFNLLFRSISI